MQFKPEVSPDDESLICRLCAMIVEAGQGDRRGRGSELTDRILEQLPSRQFDAETVERLAKWCNMANREPEVEGYFRQISRTLFGKSLERTDGLG